MRLSLSSPKDCAAIQCHSGRSPNAIKCHKIGAKKRKTAMAIETLPAKDLKKPAEIPVDFTTLIQKAIKFDMRKQKKGKK